MLSDLWRNITDNLGSYLGTVVVTALVSFASWPFRRLRAASGKPVTVYLASTTEDLAKHEAAIEDQLTAPLHCGPSVAAPPTTTSARSSNRSSFNSAAPRSDGLPLAARQRP